MPILICGLNTSIFAITSGSVLSSSGSHTDTCACLEPVAWEQAFSRSKRFSVSNEEKNGNPTEGIVVHYSPKANF